MDGSQIVGNTILNLAKIKARKLKTKYPKTRITVEWNSWYEGKKGKNNHNVIEIPTNE